MRRKFKDFLNKRVISGTLSAAIAFNMAAYIPMSAFAHDETSAETTVDLNEINISGQLMSNSYLAMNAPFRVPQYGSITTETEYTEDDIPQFWQAFDNLTSPTVIAQGRLFQTEEDRPDKVQFCNWGSINGVNWDYLSVVEN